MDRNELLDYKIWTKYETEEPYVCTEGHTAMIQLITATLPPSLLVDPFSFVHRIHMALSELSRDKVLCLASKYGIAVEDRDMYQVRSDILIHQLKNDPGVFTEYLEGLAVPFVMKKCSASSLDEFKTYLEDCRSEYLRRLELVEEVINGIWPCGMSSMVAREETDVYELLRDYNELKTLYGFPPPTMFRIPKDNGTLFDQLEEEALELVIEHCDDQSREALMKASRVATKVAISRRLCPVEGITEIIERQYDRQHYRPMMRGDLKKYLESSGISDVNKRMTDSRLISSFFAGSRVAVDRIAAYLGMSGFLIERDVFFLHEEFKSLMAREVWKHRVTYLEAFKKVQKDNSWNILEDQIFRTDDEYDEYTDGEYDDEYDDTLGVEDYDYSSNYMFGEEEEAFNEYYNEYGGHGYNYGSHYYF